VKIQLWSYNYDPEPLGVGPISTVWATAMASRGHDVEVVTAHPHYPKPQWGKKLLPYREVRDGIPVTRLPLIIGRASRSQRMLQELSFLAAQTAASPFLGTPDALVSVSPSFPALLPALLNSRARKMPWVIWLQDILPDGAAASGYVNDSSQTYRWSRSLEDAAYRSASKIALLSDSFRQNLIRKGVPDSKLNVIFNPATLPVRHRYLARSQAHEPPRVICMGNIGRSQGLADIVRDFESSDRLGRLGAKLVITGSGVAEGEVRAAIRTGRVEMTGLLSQRELEDQLQRASLAVVTQAYDAGEFNVPSKLMNYLAVGLPIVASVRPQSEAARIVNDSKSGWITPGGAFGATLEKALARREVLESKSQNAIDFAQSNLTPSALAEKFERELSALVT
jgi:colanic acid biosynthesis glycosyl transferase WcaI